jgi:hypothetical protein
VIVDRRRYISSLWITTGDAVVSGRPDRDASTLLVKLVEVALQTSTLSMAALSVIECRISLDQCRAMLFESIKLFAGGEDIGRKLGDVGQQWHDNFFRHPWGPILADVTITGDAGWSASAPRLEPQPSRGKMIAKSVEIDRHFEKVANNDRPSAAIGLEMASIAVEQLLIDP